MPKCPKAFINALQWTLSWPGSSEEEKIASAIGFNALNDEYQIGVQACCGTAESTHASHGSEAELHADLDRLREEARQKSEANHKRSGESIEGLLGMIAGAMSTRTSGIARVEDLDPKKVN